MRWQVFLSHAFVYFSVLGWVLFCFFKLKKKRKKSIVFNFHPSFKSISKCQRPIFQSVI